MEANMIEVKQHYNRIDGISIRPGLYAEDDVALHGLATFLIATGRAQAIIVTVATDVPSQSDAVVVTHTGGLVGVTPPAPRKRKGSG